MRLKLLSNGRVGQMGEKGQILATPSRVNEGTVIFDNPSVHQNQQRMWSIREAEETARKRDERIKKQSQQFTKEMIDDVSRKSLGSRPVPEKIEQRLLKSYFAKKAFGMREGMGRLPQGDFQRLKEVPGNRDYGFQVVGSNATPTTIPPLPGRADFRHLDIMGNPFDSEGQYGPSTDFERYMQQNYPNHTVSTGTMGGEDSGYVGLGGPKRYDIAGGVPSYDARGPKRYDIGNAPESQMGAVPKMRYVGTPNLNPAPAKLRSMSGMGSWLSDVTGINLDVSEEIEAATPSLMDQAEKALSDPNLIKSATNLITGGGSQPTRPAPTPVTAVRNFVASQTTGTTTLPGIGTVQKKYLFYGAVGILGLGIAAFTYKMLKAKK